MKLKIIRNLKMNVVYEEKKTKKTSKSMSTHPVYGTLFRSNCVGECVDKHGCVY